MNTSNIKKYAPKARADFMAAVAKRLNKFGIYADKAGQVTISEPQISGSVMQIDGNSFDATLSASRNNLAKKAKQQGFSQFVEHTAYTWFNRFCAIRYMELHDYLEHGLRVLSHPDKDNSFEILDHAQDVAEDLGLKRDHIVELKLAGNQDEQLYRELLIAQCHKLHQAMPFLFEALDDETELLLPDNLTRTDSILRGLVSDIPVEDWEQVEIIGWLYQFYISEKKDEVIGKVVKSEDIPAATQLFTPNWIVKYLVQNSVGRQWLQTYPDSSVKSEMEYYIEPAEQTNEVNAQLKAITPDSIDPETIKVLDPACGSGHILVEAYQLLKSIYEERGYRSRDIPKLILENNLYGIDIDDRAAQLTGFSLMMLARADDRRIFTREVQLNVVAMQSSEYLSSRQLWNNLNLDGQRQKQQTDEIFGEMQSDFSEPENNADYQLIVALIESFQQAKTFGSLINIPHTKCADIEALQLKLMALAEQGDTKQKPAANALLPLFKQALILSHQYDAVVANPPYMGGKYLAAPLKKHLKDDFKGYEKDLFSAFIIRNLQLAKDGGQLGFMTPFVWMFISSYEQLRNTLINEETISTLIQLEYSGFDGATVPICTFTLTKGHTTDFIGSYIKLSDFKGHKNQAPKTLEAIQNPDCSWFYRAKPDDFKKIPGSPIAYWVSDGVRSAYTRGQLLGDISEPRTGLQTGENERFVRGWTEINIIKFSGLCNSKGINYKWVPYNKGGEFRKWYGNAEFVLNWEENGRDIRNDKLDKLKNGLCLPSNSKPKNEKYYFRECGSWAKISSSRISVRYFPSSYIFDIAGCAVFTNSSKELDLIIGFLNTPISMEIFKIISPTLNYQPGDVAMMPILPEMLEVKNECVSKLINYSRLDWNTYETSWDFQNNPLIINQTDCLSEIYSVWQAQNRATITEMQRLEHENNRLFIDAYGLQDELTPDVPLEQITLTVNPKYRYGGKLSEAALENRFQSDTLAELISYSIGCMMGRYSLDKEGLVYAHAGNEGFTELEQQGAYKTFPVDDDGIIPLTDQEWFEDDVTLRFRDFVQTVWGSGSLSDGRGALQANLDFVAESLCLHAIKPKSGETSLDTIRRYLSTQFYKDHKKTYKKRPIYWLFSSGKQKAFECLVYLHRYNAGTLARMRTEYVTPLLGKYDATADTLSQQIEQASSTAESNRLAKSLTALEKKQAELREFDDKLKHHADMQITLDLDDGVKVNYGKFGDLLVDVKGVTGKK